MINAHYLIARTFDIQRNLRREAAEARLARSAELARRLLARRSGSAG